MSRGVRPPLAWQRSRAAHAPPCFCSGQPASQHVALRASLPLPAVCPSALPPARACILQCCLSLQASSWPRMGSAPSFALRHRSLVSRQRLFSRCTSRWLHANFLAARLLTGPPMLAAATRLPRLPACPQLLCCRAADSASSPPTVPQVTSPSSGTATARDTSTRSWRRMWRWDDFARFPLLLCDFCPF